MTSNVRMAAPSSVPVLTIYDNTMEALSTSLASLQPVNSIIEVGRSANAAVISSAGIVTLAHAARGSHIKTLNKTLHMIPVGKAAVNLVPVMATGLLASWPTIGTSDQSATIRSSLPGRSKVSNKEAVFAQIFLVAMVCLVITIALILVFIRWLRKRRSLSQQRTSQQQEPEHWIAMRRFSQPYTARLAEEQTVLGRSPASTISSGSTSNPVKPTSRERLRWVDELWYWRKELVILIGFNRLRELPRFARKHGGRWKLLIENSEMRVESREMQLKSNNLMCRFFSHSIIHFCIVLVSIGKTLDL